MYGPVIGAFGDGRRSNDRYGWYFSRNRIQYVELEVVRLHGNACHGSYMVGTQLGVRNGRAQTNTDYPAGGI